MSAPVTPRPAATLVLLRDGARGLEVLLLRRSPHAGFAPGAYVFPGGTVDAEDAHPGVLERMDGLTAERATERLDLPGSLPPALAYYGAALREAFEETGILTGSSTPGTAELRQALRERRVTFPEVLARLGCRLSADGLVYFAHWITPVRSPRRFDTRFFAARIPSDAVAVADGVETMEACWATPVEALRAHAGGELPMMLPTVRTLERLAGFPDTRAALVALADAPVPTILPDPEAGGFAGPSPQPRLPTS